MPPPQILRQQIQNKQPVDSFGFFVWKKESYWGFQFHWGWTKTFCNVKCCLILASKTCAILECFQAWIQFHIELSVFQGKFVFYSLPWCHPDTCRQQECWFVLLWNPFGTFLHCVASSVASDWLNEMRHIHTGCICVAKFWHILHWAIQSSWYSNWFFAN